MIALRIDTKYFLPKFHVFTGGEVHVNLLECKDEIEKNDYIKIAAKIDSSQELIKLMLTVNAIRLINSKCVIDLLLPYLPYARQDRSCKPGDAFSLEVFANILNSLKFNLITVVDPHNEEVTRTLIKNLNIIEQKDLARNVSSRLCIDYIIAPDKGAIKKAKSFADIFNSKKSKNADLLYATKKRDIDGRIVETTLETNEDLKNKNVLIVDDICDYGGTFKALANILREKGVNKVYLFVTHGILAGGLEGTGCDFVFTTDSFYYQTLENVKVVKHFFLEF